MVELYLFQKENDLIKIWGIEGEFNIDEMVSDFEFVFPEKGGAIEIGGNKIAIGPDTGNGAVSSEAVSSTAYFYNYSMERIKITVTVFK